METPDLTVVKAYLGEDTSTDDDTIEAALSAEMAAQARVCRVPSAEGAQWPADLVEALCRRVARNLYVRGVPSGSIESMNALGMTRTRIGVDAEVRRLEAPFRRLVIG